jgi:hypothetical protein
MSRVRARAYVREILVRGWQDSKRMVREHVLFDVLVALAVAGVAYALQGDSGEQAALTAGLVTVVALAGLAVVLLVCQVIAAPVRLLRERDDDLAELEAAKARELEALGAEVRELERARNPAARLSFGRPEIPRTSQEIRVYGPDGKLWPLGRRGRVIRVPVVNAPGAGEAGQVHARLRFTDAGGGFDRMYMPAETQGRWSGEPEPGEVIDLPGNGRPRLLDVVLILDGEYPNAFEWTTQSLSAGLNGYDDLCGHPHKSAYAESCVMPRSSAIAAGGG